MGRTVSRTECNCADSSAGVLPPTPRFIWSSIREKVPQPAGRHQTGRPNGWTWNNLPRPTHNGQQSVQGLVHPNFVAGWARCPRVGMMNASSIVAFRTRQAGTQEIVMQKSLVTPAVFLVALWAAPIKAQ